MLMVESKVAVKEITTIIFKISLQTCVLTINMEKYILGINYLIHVTCLIPSLQIL